MSKYKQIIILATFALCILTSKHSIASSEQITDFTSNIQINSDGTVTFSEEITYNFGSNEKHGIYRYIPFITKNKDNQKYKMDINIMSVTDEKSNPYMYTLNTENENIFIKIGDPNKVLNGKHIYRINYKVYGALTYFSEHDELYWNVTGSGWEVPIVKSQANLILPNSKNEGLKATCFAGIAGSTATNCSAQVSNGRFTYKSNSTLNPGEGLTIVAGFPKGIVAVLEPKKDNSDLVALLIFSLLAISWTLWNFVFPIKIFMNWYADYKLTKKAKIVSAWFDPPKDIKGNKLSPAQTSVLVNKTFDTKQVTATIISLAQQGYIKIKQIKQKEFELNLLKNYSGEVRDFEEELLDGIFGSNTKTSVNLKSLKNDTKYGSKLENFYKKLSASMVENKLFTKDPRNIRTLYSVIGSFGFFTMALLVSFVAFIFGRKSAKKTDLGLEKYGEAKSLLNFLTSQNDQLDFQAKNQMFFEKLLPYASAFGVEDVWVKRFADLNFVNPDWYEGTNFNVLAFAAFSHNFQSTMNTTITSTTSSTGHSSGFSGGSSGGGGGGGGGGSW